MLARIMRIDNPIKLDDETRYMLIREDTVNKYKDKYDFIFNGGLADKWDKSIQSGKEKLTYMFDGRMANDWDKSINGNVRGNSPSTWNEFMDNINSIFDGRAADNLTEKIDSMRSVVLEQSIVFISDLGLVVSIFLIGFGCLALIVGNKKILKWGVLGYLGSAMFGSLVKLV